VHGDFGSNNVLADGEHITGVVDWSEAMIGDPLYDVANIFSGASGCHVWSSKLSISRLTL
jgi:aminoglycoside phosphotransferase (APT) family kinase protein